MVADGQLCCPLPACLFLDGLLLLLPLQVDDPSKYGVIILDEYGRVQQFVEKPKVSLVEVSMWLLLSPCHNWYCGSCEAHGCRQSALLLLLLFLHARASSLTVGRLLCPVLPAGVCW